MKLTIDVTCHLKINVCLFVLRLNVPVNNFSVMSGRKIKCSHLKFNPSLAWRPFYGTKANRIAPDVTPQNVASHLGLLCFLKWFSSKNEIKMKILSLLHLKMKVDSSKVKRWESPFVT